jgi:hypothetical protein
MQPIFLKIHSKLWCCTAGCGIRQRCRGVLGCFQRLRTRPLGQSPTAYRERLVWEETANGWVTAIRSGDEVLWLAAPNAVVAAQILNEMPEFQE